MNSQPQSSSTLFKDIEIGTGTWAWGDRLYWGYGYGYGEKDIKAAFQQSYEAGIRFFDTAEIFAQGRSEQFLGKFIEELNPSLFVATKFMPYPWRLSRVSLVKALKQSLKRLQLPRVDLYQIHYPMPPLSIETWMEAMVDGYNAGLTGAIGISNFNRIQLQRAYDGLIHQGVQLASNQVEYSLLNRKVEKNGLLKHCNDLGVTVIAYSPLAQGLLSGKYSTDNPPHGIRNSRYSNQALNNILPLITALKKIGNEHGGLTPAQVSLNWVICKGAIPIPGAKNAFQVLENAGALSWRLKNDEVQMLDELSDRICAEQSIYSLNSKSISSL